MVRPHVAVLTIGALLAAQLLRPAARTSIGHLSKLAGAVVLGAGLLILANQSADFLDLHEVSWDAVSSEFDRRSDLATQGGSEFESRPVRSLAALPAAIFTVLFRPMLWEANNVQMVIQSLEGMVLLTLTAVVVRQWRHLLRMARKHPYVMFCAIYALGFVWAFSGIGNFGILARQRTLMLPALLVLLALVGRQGRPQDAKAIDDDRSSSPPLARLTS